MPRPSAVILFCLATMLGVAMHGAADSPERACAARQAVPRDGVTVLWGGGEVPASLLERFAKLAAAGPVAVVTGEADPSPVASLFAYLAKTKNIAIQSLPADSEGLIQRLASFKAVWIDVPSLPPGSSPLDQVLIAPDLAQSAPPDALLETLKKRPGLIGLWVSRETGLIVRGRQLEVVGAAEVVMVLPASATQPVERPALVRHLRSGDRADLVASSRAAIARLGPRFPPETTPAPEVASGTLLPCGGGRMSDAVWQRFIELAGGVDAQIVILPVAMPLADPAKFKGADGLRRLGCRNVTVLHQHTRQDVESPEFVEALKRATGVWFAGGRQWRYVDAYEGTVAEQLLHDVLRRGGVIGGSSAGAAIQGQFMVRGDPLGNKNIIAEGYERGLNFLPGAAIDIHVAERRRLNDVVELIRVYPQLLGIAMDEAAAAEIHGSVMTVLGSGQVTIVDSHTDARSVLKAGDRFDLAKRKQLD